MSSVCLSVCLCYTERERSVFVFVQSKSTSSCAVHFERSSSVTRLFTLVTRSMRDSHDPTEDVVPHSRMTSSMNCTSVNSEFLDPHTFSVRPWIPAFAVEILSLLHMFYFDMCSV